MLKNKLLLPLAVLVALAVIFWKDVKKALGMTDAPAKKETVQPKVTPPATAPKTTTTAPKPAPSPAPKPAAKPGGLLAPAADYQMPKYPFHEPSPKPKTNIIDLLPKWI